jgi:hypothetical protein
MNDIQLLAARVREGDPAATGELRRELESKVRHLVRRTLRTGASNSPLARRILAEAERLSSTGGESDREALIACVARGICETVLGQLRGQESGVRGQESGVRSQGSGRRQEACETVCN